MGFESRHPDVIKSRSVLMQKGFFCFCKPFDPHIRKKFRKNPKSLGETGRFLYFYKVVTYNWLTIFFAPELNHKPELFKRNAKNIV